MSLATLIAEVFQTVPVKPILYQTLRIDLLPPRDGVNRPNLTFCGSSDITTRAVQGVSGV